MPREITGSLDGTGLRIGVVVARFNAYITERLLAGALAALRDAGVAGDDVTIVRRDPAGIGLMATRRQSREIALQALYRIELTGDASPEALELLWQHFEAPLDARGFALSLVHGVLAQREAIDQLLADAAENW